MAFARMFMHSYSRGRAWKWLDNQPSDKHRPAGVERERAADSRNFERQPTRKSGFKSLSISGGVMARLSSSFSRFTKPTHTFICSNLRNAPPFSFKLISKQSLISSSKIREREREESAIVALSTLKGGEIACQNEMETKKGGER